MESITKKFEFSDGGNELLLIALKTGFLTLITLGIYRCWAQTKIRNFIWASASLDGDSFEYHGTGLEKFLGFLLAIVILALYLGAIQAVLIFLGLNMFTEPKTQAQFFAQMGALYINIFAVFPMIAFATYRARRYRMLRTSWRGIRSGMEDGAWGYVWRSMMYNILAVLSLGLLLPLAKFRL